MAKLSLDTLIATISSNGKKASRKIHTVPVAKINKALLTMAKFLETEKISLQQANQKDLESARQKGLSSAMIDRLTLSDKTIGSMAQGLREVAALPSTIGNKFDKRTRPNGLTIYKVKVPIGVVGIIYESRPNVTVDAAAICLKSQNAVILRGGSEAFHSNMALATLFSKAMEATGLPRDAVQIVPTTDREAVEKLLAQDKYIDLIIPRGGESLIKMVVEKSRIPVIKHYKGVCHIYVSQKADIQKALEIIVNAKVQRPGVCNAMETLLLDNKLSDKSKKILLDSLIVNGVTLFGDPATRKLVKSIKKATIDDWYAEYLDLRCAVKTVNGVDEAIEHINTYSSHHTDAIISKSPNEIAKFLNEVDSSSVMANASTRFADGGEYGMGCEIGISTDKLHSRGPMGVEDLTTYKWIVEGSGQVRK